MTVNHTALAALAAIAVSAPACAALTISAGATQNMSCSDGICVPTAASAVLNASDLENDLAQFGNMRVMTTGNGVEANNIVVKTSFASPDSTSLTLDAHNAIVVDAAVSIGSGTAELELQSDTLDAADTLSFGRKGHVTFGSLSDLFGMNGIVFTLVGSVQGLASALTANPSGAFALANDYDASGDGTYTQPPVSTSLAGFFEGLGNNISNLTISVFTAGGHVGLLADVGSTGLVENLRIAHVSLTLSDEEGIGGPLAGGNAGRIQRVSATGEVTNIGAKGGYLGGLVGANYGTIQWSSSAAEVGGGTADFGGLVGENDGGTISHSSASGAVSGDGGAGGLVGQNGGTITRCFATGIVSIAKGSAGGLAGENGNNVGVISESYSTGTVSNKGRAQIGGLVGVNFASGISESYSTGAVVGGNETWLGGFLGWNYDGTVTQAYSTGLVSTSARRLIAIVWLRSPTQIDARSYFAVKHPNHRTSEGGFVGYDDSKTGGFSDAYWDTDTSGITSLSQGAGNISNDPGITGLTTEQFQSGLPSGFDPKIWAEDSSINNGFPYLIHNAPQK
ncbi:MAG TPA: GLUG motif-containing protein [Rhizomicrobium sp.]|nr:GLUG motif-containing protein [Rhizomicrobium sp.]